MQIAEADVKLKQRLDDDDAFGLKGEESEYWYWYHYLHKIGKNEYEDWYREDVIRKMALNEGIVDDLYPFVERVINIGADYIDQEVAHKF